MVPYGIGTGYRMTFSDTSRLLLVANVESDGCRDAILPGIGRRATNESFWEAFASTLGFDVGDSYKLFPHRLASPAAEGRAPTLRDRFAPRRL
jgi:hypothetical protein